MNVPAPRQRGFGFVLIGASVAHLLATVLLWVAFGTFLWAMIIAIGSAKMPEPEHAQDIERASIASLVMLAGALLSLLIGLALDAVGAVMSLRRLLPRRRAAVPALGIPEVAVATDRPGQGTPMFHLIVVAVMLVMTLGCALVIGLSATIEDLQGLLMHAILALWATWALLLPALRLAQLIAGIVRAARGDPEQFPVIVR